MLQQLILEICNELDVLTTTFSNDWAILLSKNGQNHLIIGYKFDLNDQAAGKIADDKYALYELLKIKEVPVVEYKIMYKFTNDNDYANGSNSLEEAIRYFNENNHNIVIKPNEGTCGNNVMKITSQSDLEIKLPKLLQSNFSISLCPFYDAVAEYRAIMLDGECQCLYGKERPILIGDGKSSIRDLLLKFNYLYFKDNHHFFNKDFDINYIPKIGEVIEYGWQFNLAKGSQVFTDISDIKKQRLESLANQAVKASNLRFCSVDIIETYDDKYYVMEINSGVMIDRYIKLVENGYDIAKDIYKKAIISMFKL